MRSPSTTYTRRTRRCRSGSKCSTTKELRSAGVMEHSYVASIVVWWVWHLPGLKVSLTRAGETAASWRSGVPAEDGEGAAFVATGSWDCQVPRIAGVAAGGDEERSMSNSANWSGRMSFYRPRRPEDTVTHLTAKDSPTPGSLAESVVASERRRRSATPPGRGREAARSRLPELLATATLTPGALHPPVAVSFPRARARNDCGHSPRTPRA